MACCCFWAAHCSSHVNGYKSPKTAVEFRALQRARAGDGEELASQARYWMDAPIRIVRLSETWSGACFDANDETAGIPCALNLNQNETDCDSGTTIEQQFIRVFRTKSVYEIIANQCSSRRKSSLQGDLSWLDSSSLSQQIEPLRC